MKPQAIVFDLDDTLVDTFTHLITPLERIAAGRMVVAGAGEPDAGRVTEVLLRLRRSDPERIEELLLQEFPELTEKALAARRAVFANAIPKGLRIEPKVKRMLRELTGRCDVHLLTSGPPSFQHEKVEHLAIRHLFRQVVILDSSSEQSKESFLASLVSGNYRRDSVVVVGNRLDNEIRAGNQLGMVTVWVKSGEGSHMSPGAETSWPDYTIRHVSYFQKLLPVLQSKRR